MELPVLDDSYTDAKRSAESYRLWEHITNLRKKVRSLDDNFALNPSDQCHGTESCLISQSLYPQASF